MIRYSRFEARGEVMEAIPAAARQANLNRRSSDPKCCLWAL